MGRYQCDRCDVTWTGEPVCWLCRRVEWVRDLLFTNEVQSEAARMYAVETNGR